jgi:adenylate cyclase
MSARTFVFAMTLASVAGIYLFVTAPPPLSEARADEGAQRIAVRSLFELCNAENAAVRQLYTKAIVADGTKVGLEFDEHWRDPNVHAGPLPALFLRETGRNLERGQTGLGLFLGSDQPVQRANRFTGPLEQTFAQLRSDGAPRFFYIEDVKMHAAMFPDIAVSQACVDCHNRHPQSPKRDWKLNDVMGAVTWTYPADSLTVGDTLKTIAALRQSVAAVYSTYLDKVSAFPAAPEVSNRWPNNGYTLPNQKVFMEEVARRSSPGTLGRLLTLR